MQFLSPNYISHNCMHDDDPARWACFGAERIIVLPLLLKGVFQQTFWYLVSAGASFLLPENLTVTLPYFFCTHSLVIFVIFTVLYCVLLLLFFFTFELFFYVLFCKPSSSHIFKARWLSPVLNLYCCNNAI